MAQNNFFQPFPLSKNIQSNMLTLINEPNKIIRFGINPVLVNSKANSKGEFEFLFVNNVYPIEFKGTGNIDIIKKPDLKIKLENFIKQSDKKYIKLKDFTHIRSTFIFDYTAWLDDCLKNVKLEPFSSSWDRVCKLKIIPPYMARTCAMRLDIEKYIGTYFKKYIERHPYLRKELIKHIPDSAFRVFNLQPENLFDFQYEYTTNRIIARLKAMYVAVVLSFMTKMTDKKMFGFGRI